MEPEENKLSPQEEKKKQFLEYVQLELDELVKQDRLPRLKASERFLEAKRLNHQFSNDVRRDAKMFALSGLANDRELLSILNNYDNEE